MKESRLDQPREWVGHWWRPDHPEAVSAGVLTYDPEKGVALRLIGGWSRFASTELVPGLVAHHDEIERWPVIHGRSGDSQLTIVEPWVSHTIGPYREDPHEMTLAALTLLDGCHLKAPDSPDFIGASVTVENLAGWVGWGQAEIRARGQRSPQLDDEEPRRTVVAAFGDVEARLHSSSDYHSTEFRRDGHRETRRSDAAVQFTSDTPRPMNEWFSMTGAVSDLVSLATMSACADITISLVLPPAPELFPKGDFFADRPRVVDVYQLHTVKPDPEGKAAVWNDFVVSEADLPWAQLFPAWLQVRDRFAAARSMVLGLRYITRSYLDSRVVTAVGAAEAFHRALDTLPPIPPDEFANLRALLVRAVPKERRGWVNDRVAYNEPSLKQRLVEMATRPGAFMTKLVPDPDRWAKTAARVRNDLAHRGHAGTDYDLLHAVVEVTSAVVVVNLLKEMGIPVRRLESALSEHPEFKWACTLAQKHFTAPSTIEVHEG
ncbi:HEPN domain-containing protein [Microbacterium binotii]|uniref:ApeA N-terminal domain 1-containing protein n=1 Tax=Microbacterium binotii TaxID=462710 RepID=UPI001F1D702A|nr:HEPN domain-containing protein [Microbacterium binotii]UIN30634.1 hypothetical protein LXM64_00055 [Microbacterium binotii]